MQSVKIVGTGVYLPENKVYNEYFIEHFKKQKLPVEGLMKHMGRRKRYLASDYETSLSMAIEAVNNCLNKFSTSPDELNMLVFVSDIPEYFFPANAMKIIDAIKASGVSMMFDFNSNCTGMLMAMDVVKNYMKADKRYKKALVVGSFNISSIVKKNDTIVYPNFADAAAAVLLERSEDETKTGFLDTETFVDSSYQEHVTFPKCGMSKMAFEKVELEDKKLEWNPFDMKFISDKWEEMIRKVLQRNQLQPNDIDYYIFSQLSDYDNMLTLEKLGVEGDKYFFLGTEYGYTGNTCPILVLNRMWDTIASEGNKVIFCSVGAGYMAIVQLYQF